ncbi:MAG: DNA alkylation repair protein [Eubacteriales bacterium]|nr:DNA alkylation repair protein [Eubacteriales bacterium]
MMYSEVLRDLESIENLRTKDVDRYNKRLIKEKADVSDLREHILENQLLHRTYFQVSMGVLPTNEQRFRFIEENFELLQDWWHVDQLIQFLKKPVDFDYAFEKAKEYIMSEYAFARRWGYVLLLAGLQKDISHTKAILSLMKDDEEYYVQMAEAWLIADLGVYNIGEVKEFLSNTKLKYNITGKAVQKLCDSFRISKEDKESLKKLRPKLKEN